MSTTPNALIHTKHYDTVVIGAGAAGMAAARTAAQAGCSVAMIEREEHVGGILMQCIHNGFGLHTFKKELTGPEYAEEYATSLAQVSIDIYLETTVIQLDTQHTLKTIHAYSALHGVLALTTKSVVLAMGCRERNRGNIGIPGSRPAGVFTAGLAQRLLNIEGYVPGKRVVIVGSGDIGLIMARRMTWVGAKVLAVVEIMPYASGLTRNIVQCLHDFNIPLYLSHAVTHIKGTTRVRGVKISPLVHGVPTNEGHFTLTCDTILLSVGLIPENELSRKAGVILSPNTGGATVDGSLQTNIPGVFACGNALHVHDLVDYVTEEAQECGQNVARFVHAKKRLPKSTVPLQPGSNIKYTIPNACTPGKDIQVRMRALVVAAAADLIGTQGSKEVFRKKLMHIHPAEMITYTIPSKCSKMLKKDTPLTIALIPTTPKGNV